MMLKYINNGNCVQKLKIKQGELLNEKIKVFKVHRVSNSIFNVVHAIRNDRVCRKQNKIIL